MAGFECVPCSLGTCSAQRVLWCKVEEHSTVPLCGAHPRHIEAAHVMVGYCTVTYWSALGAPTHAARARAEDHPPAPRHTPRSISSLPRACKWSDCKVLATLIGACVRGGWRRDGPCNVPVSLALCPLAPLAGEAGVTLGLRWP